MLYVSILKIENFNSCPPGINYPVLFSHTSYCRYKSGNTVQFLGMVELQWAFKYSIHKGNKMNQTVSSADKSGRSKLENQLINECESMITYALAAGKTIPGKIVQTLEDITGHRLNNNASGKDKTTEEDSTESPGAFHKVSELVTIHNKLVQIVEPANPGTILLLEHDMKQNSVWRVFGPLPIIRRMMFTAVCCTASFILISLSDEVNANSITQGVFTSSGFKLLLNLLFLLTAAGIGASFSALFEANKFIVEGTYDPKYEASYWSRFVLGLISGLLLAELIPLDTSQSLNSLSKPVLSLLGGFSSSVVYKVLKRLVMAVDTLVSGRTKDIISSAKLDAKNQINQKVMQNKMSLVSEIIKLQKEIDKADNPAAIKQKLNTYIEHIIPDAEESQLT